eukprot:5898834-Alexandrium_andersonii.AAC.1
MELRDTGRWGRDRPPGGKGSPTNLSSEALAADTVRGLRGRSGLRRRRVLRDADSVVGRLSLAHRATGPQRRP